ncbi:MAG: hypothetical protein SGI86_18240 [Deltaproteobacteria bacterium]|nr:hypothetical protein [Deltaproteobacteria bacterium]
MIGDGFQIVESVPRQRGLLVRVWNSLDPDRRTFALGYLVLLPLFLMPVFVTKFLPGLDLPFHLSIADMLMKADDPASPYAPYYESRLGFAPYAAHYLLLVGLGRFMVLALAHNVVMGIYIAVLPLCCSYLLAVSGKSRLPALLAFPLCFNMTLHYGFISFCLSLPALLLWLALTADLLARPSLGIGWRAARLPVLAGLVGCLLYLCHLQNYLFGICAVGAMCVLGPGGWRRRALGVAAIVPSALSLVLWWRRSPFAGDAAARHGSFDFAWETLKNARMADLQWGQLPLRTDIENRIGWFPDHLLKGFVDLIDVRVANAILFAAAFYYLLGWLGAWMGSGQKRRTHFRLAHTMVFLGAVFAYFALPHHLREFELMTFYPRFSVLAVLLFLPLIPAGLGRISGFMRVGVMLPALLIGVLWSHSLFIHYRAYREEIADFAAVLRQTPADGKAVGIIYNRRSTVLRNESVLVGLTGFHVAARKSKTSMVPLAYCGMRHIPCAIKPNAPRLSHPGAWLEQPFEWPSLIDDFDVIYVRSSPYELLQGHARDLQTVAHVGSWISLRKKPVRGRVHEKRDRQVARPDIAD